jgi:RNA polymerase sigma-70 factor (ECF subfamily)
MTAAPAWTPTSDDDVQLMLNVQRGDRSSFGVLLERHRPAVERFLYGKVRNRALSEELAQEVFLRVYRARGTYRPTARFKSWLFQIASHLGSNSRRDHRREKLHDPLEARAPHRPALQIADRRPSMEETMLADVRLAQVRRAVAALPEKQRTAVLMHKFGGMEYMEIARALGCSVSATKSLIFRAYETLRASLAHLVSDSAATVSDTSDRNAMTAAPQ